MPYVINCPHCKQQMQMADNAAGKQFRCPFCKVPFVAPGPGATASSGASGGAAAGAAGAGGGAAVATRPAAPPKQAPPPKPPAPAAPPTACPACGSKLLEGAVSCMD